MRIFPRRHRVVLLALATLLTLTACGGNGGNGDGDGDGDGDGVNASPAKAPEVAAPAVGEGCDQHRPIIDGEIQPAFFGMHMHAIADPAKPREWPDAPIGGYRLWDSGVKWLSVQPAPEKWDLTRLDRQVEIALENGAMPLMVLGGLVPAWAAADPTTKSPYGGAGTIGAPRVEPWREYVRTLAERYKGRICAYEIWNEPDLPNFYSGTPENLADLTVEAAKIIKSVDASALVVSPGISARGGAFAWAERYFTDAVREHVDVLGVHLYPFPDDQPEEVIPGFYGFKEFFAENGLGDKPVWNTEGAMGVASGGKKHTPITGPDAEALMVRIQLLSAASGLESVYWYAWDNRVFGGLYLVEEDFVTPTPAAAAYTRAYTWLVGAALEDCQTPGEGGTWSCRLRHDGWTGLAAWHTSSGHFVVPGGFVYLCTAHGEGRAVEAGDSVTVTTSPILLVDVEGCPRLRG